jgi:hypothetical protein
MCAAEECQRVFFKIEARLSAMVLIYAVWK